MLDLILFPFRLLWDVLCFVFDIVAGAIGLVFGLAGGLIGLVVRLCLLGAAISLLCLLFGHRRRKAMPPENDGFIHYHDKDAVQ